MVIAPLKIALIQTNPLVGDFAGTLQQIQEQLHQAHNCGCVLVVFPELALCGAPLFDLPSSPAFLAAHDRALQDFLTLTTRFPRMVCVIGGLDCASDQEAEILNAAFVVENGVIQGLVHKGRLALDSVFRCQGLSCALNLGEDPALLRAEARSKACLPGETSPDLLIHIAARPWYAGLRQEREQAFATLCRTCETPLVYVGQAGGQGRQVYDGHSLVMDRTGAIRACAAGFAADLLIADFPEPVAPQSCLPAVPEEGIADLEAALVCGLKDYVCKSGFSSVVLGLSGGIDSALTAALACKALGPDKVLGVALPSPYTSELSIQDAKQLADNLGCRFAIIPIEPAMRTYADLLAPHFAGLPEDTSEQNIQARIRGNILMALANKERRLLLSTGNKSELAVGYCTLYGDMCGSLAVLADVFKTEVYRLSHWINREREIIPASTIERPPTAELKPDQCDQDDLPPYGTLDQILRLYVEKSLPVESIAVALKVELALVRDVARRVRLNEYKREQAAPGIQVSKRPFGPDRRMPSPCGFLE